LNGNASCDGTPIWNASGAVLKSLNSSGSGGDSGDQPAVGGEGLATTRVPAAPKPTANCSSIRRS
jgi:hypothetical protein